MSETGLTRAESCVIACAEVWRDAGEVMVSPFGTIPSLGARLAKRTFSPDIVLTDGEAALMVGAPPIATRPAELVREAAMPYRSVFDVVWSGRRNMMMMASQIDRTGNQNISAIGPHERPKVQLIGVRGAPGNSVNHPTSYWVPDHTVRTFVEQVDVVSGVGYVRAAAAGPGVQGRCPHHERGLAVGQHDVGREGALGQPGAQRGNGAEGADHDLARQIGRAHV